MHSPVSILCQIVPQTFQNVHGSYTEIDEVLQVSHVFITLFAVAKITAFIAVSYTELLWSQAAFLKKWRTHSRSAIEVFELFCQRVIVASVFEACSMYFGEWRLILEKHFNSLECRKSIFFVNLDFGWWRESEGPSIGRVLSKGQLLQQPRSVSSQKTHRSRGFGTLRQQFSLCYPSENQTQSTLMMADHKNVLR